MRRWTDYDLLKNRAKALWLVVGLFLFGRAFQSASKTDAEIKRELKDLPEGFSISMGLSPAGPRIMFRKKKGALKYKGFGNFPADLEFSFRSLDAAFRVFAARTGPVTAFAENRLTLRGDIARALPFLRAVHVVEAYLFPAFLLRPIFKSVPIMDFRRQLQRLKVLLLGIPFGL